MVQTDIALIISQSCLSIAQINSFQCLNTCTFMYAIPSLINRALHLVTRSTAAFNNLYSKLMPYTALANSYWVIVNDMYQCQDHAH